jgi:hypothetical protein
MERINIEELITANLGQVLGKTKQFSLINQRLIDVVYLRVPVSHCHESCWPKCTTGMNQLRNSPYNYSSYSVERLGMTSLGMIN